MATKSFSPGSLNHSNKLIFSHFFSCLFRCSLCNPVGGREAECQKRQTNKQTAEEEEEENTQEGAIARTKELFDQAKTTKRWTDDKITNQHQKPSWKEEKEEEEKMSKQGWRDVSGKRSSGPVVVWNNLVCVCEWSFFQLFWPIGFNFMGFFPMEWSFRRGNKDESERKNDGGGEEEEGIEEILPLVFLRRLSCRISFISYWCYFVLSGPPSACNGTLGAP